MRPQTDFTPDTAAQVRCALDMLRTALSAGPDIDRLTDAASDWADDVANSDAAEIEVQQCQALAFAASTMFRLLDALDAGNSIILIADRKGHATFEFVTDGVASPEFDATVENAVRRALGKGANA